MTNTESLERKSLWLWLAAAWTIIPTLTVLATQRLGDTSTSAMWRWGVLVLWTLVAPTVSALRLRSAVRALHRNQPGIPEATITALLAPAWQMVMLGVLSVLAATVLYVYYDQR